MCESIQGENIKNTQEWECAGKKTDRVYSKPRGSAREFPWGKTGNHAKNIAMAISMANDTSTNYNSLGMKSIHTLWI